MQRTYSTMTADRLAAWKQGRGLTMREAGAELGVGWRTMIRYLSGKRPIPLTVARLAWALQQIDLLKRRIDEGPPPNLTPTERAKLGLRSSDQPLSRGPPLRSLW
jgi:transcriptional regulator with XRE-family HTH domain